MASRAGGAAAAQGARPLLVAWVRRAALASTLVCTPLCTLLGATGCEPVRAFTLAQVLPAPCVSAQLNDLNHLKVRGLGDFLPSADGVGTASADGELALDLPRGTRVVTLEGNAPGGLVAFGRTAPFELADTWDRADVIPLAYGPPDTFCTTASLSYARAGHRATLLRDGSVLLSGGVDRDGFPVVVLERYLPMGDATSPLARFATVGGGSSLATLEPRAVLGHEATLLSDGRILLTGGAPAISGLASGIAYEGATVLGPEGAVESPARVLGGGPRAFHAGIRLDDGRVLLTGGCSDVEAGACPDSRLLASTVIYDPSSETFQPSFVLTAARAGHRAILRDDGLVLIVGGRGAGGAPLPPELFDPSDARASSIAGPSGSAVASASGLVVALNDGGGPSTRVVTWSGRDEAPAALTQLAVARADATLTALEDGAVLLAGGWDGVTLAPSDLVVTGGGGVRTIDGFMGRGQTATLLLDGSVLLSGGVDSSGQASTRAALFLRSLVGPFDTPPTLAFDGALTLVPSRPGVTEIVDGTLRVAGTGGRAVEAYALIAGPTLAGPATGGFDLEVLAGTDGAGEAAILYGDPGRARYVAVTLAVGARARLLSIRRERPGLLSVEEVPGCEGPTVGADELPDGDIAPVVLSARRGRIDVRSRARDLLSCPSPASEVPARGAIALGALRGRVRYDNVQLVR